MQRCSEKAFAMCPTRHLCGTIHEATFTENSDCAEFNRRVDEMPMTNGDRIRSMTDEELAVFICCRCRDCSIVTCPGAELCNGKDGVANGMVKWLEQPAENE